MPTTYFLLIDGIAGDSAIPGFEGWFDLDAFSLGQSHSGTTHFGANGGAGRLNVQDLSVSLSGNAGLTSLLNSTSMGSHIDAIQIVGISSNDQAIVYELTLNDIMTTSVSEESAQNNVPILDVTFNFGQFGLVTTTQNQDGSLGGQQSYGYDTTTNEVIDPATLDEPTPSRAVLASNPTTYYLLIDGIAGDSTDEGYEGWFKLDAFNLGQSQSGTTHTGPGDGAGRVDIQDLSVELSGNTGLADFLNGSATGIYLDALQIEGVTRRDATVYQLTLNDILVTSVNETTEPNGASSLDVAFNFSQIGLVTTGQNPDGSPASPGTEQSYGWNLVDNTYLDPATLDAPTSLPAFGNSAPTTYFLSIDGIAGDSTARGFEGWFELDGFNLGQSQAATTHTGAGAVSVRDLSIALSGNAGLTSLLNSTSLGAHIEAIQIVGISGNDQAIVYELTLNDIITTSVSEAAVQSDDPHLEATFNFGQIGLVMTSQNPDGSLGGQQSYGYDIAANEVIDPAILDEPTPAPAVLASNPTTYYLLIDGIAGDSTDEGYEGWFKLDAFSLGQSQSGTTHSGPGGGAGRVNIQDLSVALSGNKGLTDFLNGSANGIRFNALQIEGVTQLDATVYQLTLNDILVTSVNETAEPNSSSLDVAFNFSQIGLVTTGQNPDGSPGTEQSYGWNLVDNTYLDPTTLDAPTSLPAVGNSAPSTYFLSIDGIAGDSTARGFEGWFELDAFSLGQSYSGTTHSGVYGGAGRLNVQDLSIALSGNAGLTSLLNSTSLGAHIEAIQIVGISDNDQAIVYELTLNDIITTSVSEDAAPNGAPSLNATFNFDQIGLVTTSQNPDGSLGGQQSYGYDIAEERVIDPEILDEPTPARAVLVPNPTTYYLLIDGIAGDSTDEGYEGWFKLNAFSLGQSQSGTTHSGPGGGTSPVNIQDLSVVLSGNTGLTDFLNSSATGIFLDALQIEGVNQRDGTVYQLTLNNILVTDVYEVAVSTNTPRFEVVFNFNQIGLVTASHELDGSPGREQLYGWDIVDNTYLDPATLDVPSLNISAPVISSDGGGATADINVVENQTIVTTVNAADTDSGTTLTYAIAGGADASAFSIDRLSGALTFAVAPDFEAPLDIDGDNIYQVIVQTSDGEFVDSQTLSVTVTNVVGASIAGTVNADVVTSTHTVAGQLLPTGEEDTIVGNSGHDVIRGGAGADSLSGGEGIDWLLYTGSNAGVTVDLNADSITGMQSASGGDAAGDQIQGFEHVRGSDFADILTGNGERNVLIGDDGADVISGGGGNDLIRGGAGADVISGGDGNDLIRGGSGADTMAGGERIDWLLYIGSGAGVTIDLNADSITGMQSASGGDAEGDQIQGFEFVRGSDFADVLTGNDERNVLIGDDGADTIAGNDGNDVIRGGAGADSLSGGEGIDWLQYTGSNAGVTIDLAADPITGMQSASGGDAAGDQIQGFEFVRGSDFADVLTGNDERNVLIGDDGADTIAGNDGNDVIRGGAGADSLSGGEGIDWLLYTGSNAGVTVDLNADSITGMQSASGGDAAGDQIQGFEFVRGSDFADVLAGNDERNVLIGNEGADTITGNGGNDVIRGGAGADSLSGGDGIDWLLYNGSDAGVTVDLGSITPGVQTASGGHAEGDVISGFENLRGSSFGDALTGHANRNVIYGGDGDDVLSGFSGNDVLSGGAGADSFLFFVDDGANGGPLVGAGGVARILDFDVTEDSIVLVSLLDPTLSIVPLPENFVSNTTGQAENVDQFYIYNSATGELSMDVDGSGLQHEAIIFAELSPNLGFSVDYFGFNI